MRKKDEQSEWYFFKAGSHAGMKAGPLTWERLCSQAAEGTLEPEDVVWDPGSGWRTADQVPGLFAAMAVSGTGGAEVDTPPEGASTGGRGHSWLPWVAALIVLVIIGASLGGYYGCAGDDGGVITSEQTTTTASAATTTVPGVTSQSSTTVQSTSTTVAGSTTGDGSVVYLGESDIGREVRLNVGDRVRIELEPEVDRVISVRWDFIPVVVKYVDSGWTETEGQATADCWVELEAQVVGPVTVRARYEYVSGVVGTPWACYLVVTEPETE